MVAATDSEDSSLQVGPPRQAASPQPTSPSPVSRRTKTKFIISRVVKDILCGRSTGMSAWITRTSAIFIVPHYPCCEDGRQARSQREAQAHAFQSTAEVLAFPRAQPRIGIRYSITRSARTSTEGGMASPSVLAVLRLISSSNFVGCSTGKSAALAPLRILSTYVAAWRNKSGMLGEYDMSPPRSTNSLDAYIVGSRLFVARPTAR